MSNFDDTNQFVKSPGSGRALGALLRGHGAGQYRPGAPRGFPQRSVGEYPALGGEHTLVGISDPGPSGKAEDGDGVVEDSEAYQGRYRAILNDVLDPVALSQRNQSVRSECVSVATV